MNRLSTRLLLSMFLIVVVALAIVPVAQTIAARRSFDQLEADFRDRILERTKSPRRHFDTDDKPVGPPAVREERLFFEQENERLFAFVRDYRQTQRQAIIWGLFGAGLLAVMLALWLSRSMAKPIEAVSKAASSLAGGDLSTRVALKGNYSQEAQELARDFNSMAQALESYEGQRQAMMADIAHELRTPLTTMQFRLDALEDRVIHFSDEEIFLLKGQVSLLARLIEDLRTLSLAEAGKLSFNPASIDLNALVKGACQQFQDKAEQANIHLLQKTHTPLILYGDADRLKQILNNLLDNALKVTPSGGWIEISLLDAVDQVVLRVRDSGPGIPENELETVFERFVQGKRRDTGDKGSGLGLAIVKSLAALHGGSVKATNHSEGAQFEVILPKHQVSNSSDLEAS